MSYNRCKDTHKFGNKYLPSAYKMQVDFRSHFSGEKVRLIVREIQYIIIRHNSVHLSFTYCINRVMFIIASISGTVETCLI